jgi:hypothetical protein
MIQPRRRMGRLAAATTAGVATLAVSGVAVAGATSGSGTVAMRQTSTSIAYTCRFPSRAQQVSLRVAAEFPAAGTVGQAIQPTGVHTTITLPRAALGDLGSLGAAKVRASATLDVNVAEGATSATAAWRVAAPRPTTLPAAGSLMLAASGAVPPAAAGAPGRVTFTANGLLLVFAPRQAAGTAGSPAALAVACGLTPGHDARLAAVPVSSPSPSPVASAKPGTARHPAIVIQQSPRGPVSQGKSSCITRAPLPGIGSAFVAGFSNVSKLHEATLLGPGPDNQPRAALSDVKNEEFLTVLPHCNPNLFPIQYQYAIGQLNYRDQNRFPPAKSTLLTFRFIPVMATLDISLVPFNCRDVGGHLVAKTSLCIQVKNPPPYTTTISTITSEEGIRVSSLAVNGVRLNVGQHCQTVAPTKVTLAGKTPQYSLLDGGPLTGDITIPRFTGCGVGENLDPLLNASVSGPRNFAILTQGPLCEKFPQTPANANCKIPPGAPGHPYGLPKFYPKPVR